MFVCPRSWQWVQTSLRCAVEDTSLTGRNPHDLSQKKSQPHRFLVQQNFETGWNPDAESRRPFDRDSPQHNVPRPVGKVEKKRTGEQAETVQTFFLNPPTETVRHGQVLSCLPPVSSRCLWKTSSLPDLSPSLYSGDRARWKLPRGQSKTLVPRYFERRSMGSSCHGWDYRRVGLLTEFYRTAGFETATVAPSQDKNHG